MTASEGPRHINTAPQSPNAETDGEDEMGDDDDDELIEEEDMVGGTVRSNASTVTGPHRRVSGNMLCGKSTKIDA